MRGNQAEGLLIIRIDSSQTCAYIEKSHFIQDTSPPPPTLTRAVASSEAVSNVLKVVPVSITTTPVKLRAHSACLIVPIARNHSITVAHINRLEATVRTVAISAGYRSLLSAGAVWERCDAVVYEYHS